MKLQRSAVMAWVNDPVTIAYMEAMGELRQQWVSSAVHGCCIAGTESKSNTSELYHLHIGAIRGLDACLPAMDFLVEFEKVAVEGEEENAA